MRPLPSQKRRAEMDALVASASEAINSFYLGIVDMMNGVCPIPDGLIEKMSESVDVWKIPELCCIGSGDFPEALET